MREQIRDFSAAVTIVLVIIVLASLGEAKRMLKQLEKNAYLAGVQSGWWLCLHKGQVTAAELAKYGIKQ